MIPYPFRLFRNRKENTRTDNLNLGICCVAAKHARRFSACKSNLEGKQDVDARVKRGHDVGIVRVVDQHAIRIWCCLVPEKRGVSRSSRPGGRTDGRSAREKNQ